MSEEKCFWSDIGPITQKKNCHIIHFFLLWQNPIANSLNLYFAIKFTRHSSILLNVAPEWLYILVLWLMYILWHIYVRPNLVMLVFVRLNSSYVRPKLKVIGQMSCHVKYLFAALQYCSTVSSRISYRCGIQCLQLIWLKSVNYIGQINLDMSNVVNV
jgi:hypothetical protein